MRKLIVNEWLTLDGVAQAPGAPDEDTSGGFARHWPNASEEAGHRTAVAALKQRDDGPLHVIGSTD